MKLIVGLGNPGGKYQNNRHNVGHMLIDYLDEERVRNVALQLVKTNVFMNVSGEEVKKYVARYKLHLRDDLVIAHDDLDIPLGKFKISKNTGPKLHNGLESVENALKTNEFTRIRIGVDSRSQDKWIDGETYVLSDFSVEERKILLENVFPVIKDRLQNL